MLAMDLHSAVLAGIDEALDAMRFAWLMRLGTPSGTQCLKAIDAVLDERLKVMALLKETA
jgi:hypothetical protein